MVRMLSRGKYILTNAWRQAHGTNSQSKVGSLIVPDKLDSCLGMGCVGYLRRGWCVKSTGAEDLMVNEDKDYVALIHQFMFNSCLMKKCIYVKAKDIQLYYIYFLIINCYLIVALSARESLIYLIPNDKVRNLDSFDNYFFFV